MRRDYHYGRRVRLDSADGRLDIEAAAAYAFPPVTGAILLVLEHNNSYIRFHAWQVFHS